MVLRFCRFGVVFRRDADCSKKKRRIFFLYTDRFALAKDLDGVEWNRMTLEI